MPKKIDYASLFTLRKDGRYQAVVRVGDKQKYIYDRDPEQLFQKAEAAKLPSLPTFKDAADGWETAHRPDVTERTWKNYKPHFDSIVAEHGAKPVTEITALDVKNDVKAAKAQGSSATIISTRRSLYRMILDYALEQGWVPYNAAEGVKMPKGAPRGRREAPPDEVMNKVLAGADLPFGLFPFLLLCTGMRKSEALALTWADVDFKAGVIHVTKALDYSYGGHPTVKEPKTAAGVRDVPMLSILRPELEKRCGKAAEPVFAAADSNRGGRGGGYINDRAYDGAWTRYCEAAGLLNSDGKPSLTAHQLRHGAATLMYENNVDELTAQRVLGHADISVTREIYTHLREARQAKSIKRLDKQMTKRMSGIMSK